MATKPRYRVAATASGEVRSVRAVAPPRMNATNLAGTSASGGFEGAQRQRRLFAFRPTEASVNSLLMFAGQTLRARARFLSRNNPYVRKAKRVFVTNLIGTGIRPILEPKTGELWNRWTDECDADGICDLYGQMELLGNALFDAGECFIRFRPRFARDPVQMIVERFEHRGTQRVQLVRPVEGEDRGAIAVLAHNQIGHCSPSSFGSGRFHQPPPSA